MQIKRKAMDLQAEMFLDVEDWIESGVKKADFLSDKSYSEAKFNYWLAKWKASQQPTKQRGLFQEVDFQEVKLGKVLEIEAPSGVRITVFA